MKSFFRATGWGITVLILLLGRIHAQDAPPKQKIADTVLVDINTEMDTTRLFSDEPVKSPLGAVIRSAVLPGWGQAYNQSYLKSLLAFAGNGYLMYKIYDYHKKWRADPAADKIRETNKKESGGSYRDRRDNMIWFEGVVYLLTLLDAYADAHLFGFDRVMGVEYGSIGDGNDNLMIKIRIRF